VSSFVRSTAHDKRYALSNDYQSHGTLVLDINIIYLEMDTSNRFRLPMLLMLKLERLDEPEIVGQPCSSDTHVMTYPFGSWSAENGPVTCKQQRAAS
jgi:hypothetical protein